MTLFISCLIIGGLGMPGWLYPVAVVLWLARLFIRALDA